jgi:4-coumarate--CoA ligase
MLPHIRSEPLQPGEPRKASTFSHCALDTPRKYWATDSLPGGRINGASPAYNIEEMSSALRTAQSKFLLTVPGSLDIAVAAAKNAGIPQEHIFLLEGEHGGFTTMKELLAIGKGYGSNDQTPAWKIPQGKKNKDICGFLNFSSGTTGLPKAVSSQTENVSNQRLTEAGCTFPSICDSPVNTIETNNCWRS